ncbi:anti-sigma B factor antagonist [Xanthomonas nasturtii]|uniref:STAS domain-containing protein n=1 Tax=Xanthomonas nasturtii TaxID=1843581 RepID=A0A3E1KJ66_9XANT|nr:STAS domain-containing protein [Xanthomonas nasturtii]MCL1500595.1 STAS domain-containing protein [Xanthomonas nasturtii]MCL1504830.1 STAS domain-containing protein [Xanthomonas nasturtii]MCL1524210.1 STAS domain-containing protein [Xanthomonas nasturtii]MCL1526421.1 STAS domain-containing protein [Xanthomonas nasturtii]MCL1530799.1 STAS domain-containing protein [Xanthomonas nasturtii]
MASNTVQRTGDTLAVTGVIDRAAVTTAWPQAIAQLDGVRTLDLAGVQRLDSAGVAMLAELAARLRHAGSGAVVGEAPGLDELRAAYRLSPTLDFQA